MVSIVIPAFNQREVTEQCIASIMANTVRPFRILLVDNGSDPPLETFFKVAPELTIIRSDRNLGFAAGVNLGLRQADGHVLLLNNDTLVPSGWLDTMLAAMNSDENIGAVGPMSNCVSGGQLIPDLAISGGEAIDAIARTRRRDFAGKMRDVARLVGFCLLIRDRAFQEVGEFDEQFGTGNFEDDDYCVRLIRAGYRLVVDESSFVFHYGSQTFQAMGLVGGAWTGLIAENEARFEDKWDLRPEDRVDSVRESLQRNREAAEKFASGDMVGAMRLYVEAIRVEPRLARNHNDLAVLLWQHGKRERAYAEVKRALVLEPDNVDARENLMDMAAALDCIGDAETFVAGLTGGSVS